MDCSVLSFVSDDARLPKNVVMPNLGIKYAFIALTVDCALDSVTSVSFMDNRQGLIDQAVTTLRGSSSESVRIVPLGS